MASSRSETGTPVSMRDGSGISRRDILAGAALGAAAAAVPRLAFAEGSHGQLTWAIHVSLAPTWFDPAETPGIITPFMVLYALHDGIVKPMPGNMATPSLAESFAASEDSLTYDFVIRAGVKFHNGDPVTAEDVKFSFERYRGTSNALLKERVAAVEISDERHVRFRLKKPWPDFLTFYSNASGAGWIVPKKYVEKVGDDGFKKHPIGAGPYKFVSFTPGIELVMEANEGYWRKTPSVKRLVFRSIPDESTRLAALKGGEVDIAYSIRGELAAEVQHTPGLTLKAPVPGSQWLYFADQWDPKSPWYDLRVRRAASLAIDRPGINKALTLGKSRLTNSIIPESFEFYWQPPAPVYDPKKAKQLLAEAGHPNGFDAGQFYVDASYSNVAEALLNNFAEIGIKTRLRPLERAAFFKAYGDKSLKNVIYGGSGAFGNAATRLEAFYVEGGTYAYGSYPDIDEMFQQQAVELDNKKRTVILQKMQQLAYERSIYAPIWLLGFLNGVGPRVGESGFQLIPGYAYTAPYEDITLSTASCGVAAGLPPGSLLWRQMPIGAVRQSSLAALRLGVRRAPHFALAPNRGDPDTADRYRVPWFLLMEWEETAGCSREDHPRPAANERPFWGHEGRFPPPGLNGRYRFSKLSASVDQDF